MLCELAQTDHHRFRVLEPDGDHTKAIRALTRAREDLVGTRTGMVNQLRAELAGFWPGPLGLFSHVDTQISLAFLERYPSPADARGLGVARMQAFLVQEHYSGGQRPAALMAKLRSAPRGRVGEPELAARRRLVLTDRSAFRAVTQDARESRRRSDSMGRTQFPRSAFASPWPCALAGSWTRSTGNVACAANEDVGP